MAEDEVGLSTKRVAVASDIGNPLLKGGSFSGGERDCLFLSQGGRQFADVSGVSGLDHPGDGRVSAFVDFDRDGWRDVVVANNNAPEFKLYRNEVGARPGAAEAGRFLALRFVGGNTKAERAEKLSPRDGFGARVWVELPDGRRLLREHRCGEGFSGQNSAVLLVGLGKHERARVRVEWPGGQAHELADAAAGTLLTTYEVPEQAPGGKAFVAEPYVRGGSPTPPAPSGVEGGKRFLVPGAETKARLRMYTTMATWCGTCRAELPHLERLRRRFSEADLALFAIATDAEDTPAKLDAYVAERKPAYQLLRDLDKAEAKRLQKAGWEAGGAGAEGKIPVTVVTDAEGRVLLATVRAPTISELSRLIED